MEEWLEKARDSIIKYSDDIFNYTITLSELKVCGFPINGFVVIPDRAYTELLINAFNKKPLISEKRNGKYRYLLFDDEKYLIISKDKHKILFPGESISEKLRLFEESNKELTEIKEREKNQCEICAIDCKMVCSKFKVVYYCSVEHQKQHWSLHKQFCSDFIFQEKIPVIKRNPILVQYENLTKSQPKNK
jgi:hypothetical protein